ncbi:MAG: ABC transporter permease [Candidatus Pacebacteria bacterium]|nr:ABC transporter permease [Candidatus Paceibacterota bacterium]
MIPGILDSACQQGFLYAIAVFGVVVTLRIMNWPDLTVDGSFTLGGAVVATMLTTGHDVWTAMILAAAAGFAAGTATFLLNRKLGISKILSGILVMLVLYSINLRIMGRANISLLRIDTLFSGFDDRGQGDPLRIVVFFAIAAIFFVGLCYLAITRLGLFLRATGDNEFMVQSLGVNTNWLYLIGMGLSNALVAVSGALVAQHQGFADISMGTGLIITGIAALIIGESLLAGIASVRRLFAGSKPEANAKAPSVVRLLPWKTFGELTAAAIGAFLYFLIIAVCLRLGLAPTDLRLATGVLVIIGIGLQLRGPTVETYMRGQL